MNAGLSCPDWPLCYGKFIPASQMNLQVFLEWFHRLVASSMGLLTFGLAGVVWWYRRSLPSWLGWFSFLCLALVLTQGALGAFTVTELLRFDIVTAHLGTGLLFFATLTTGAIALGNGASGTQLSSKLPWMGLATVIVVYCQSILGGLVASQWALHQCLAAAMDFCQVMNNHLWGIAPVCGTVLITGIWAVRQGIGYWGIAALGLLCLQVAIGYTTYRLHLQVAMLTVAHQSVGAMLLATLIGITVLGFQKAENH